MKIHSDMPSEDIQIQILPLIDVIFCILTFFILAALQLTRQQAIGVDLPKASTGTPQMREMLVVTISPTGQIFADKDLVDRNSLRQRLEVYRNNRPDGLLVLNASKLAFYNDVVQVLDVMRAVGGDRVALATLPAEANQIPGAVPNSVPGAAPNQMPGTVPTMPSDIFGNPNAAPGNPTAPLPGGLPGQTGQPNSPVPGSVPGSVPGNSFPGGLLTPLPGTGTPGGDATGGGATGGGATAPNGSSSANR